MKEPNYGTGERTMQFKELFRETLKHSMLTVWPW